MNDERLAKMINERIAEVMRISNTRTGGNIRWFYSFGTLLEYLADRTFGMNFDIDIGVFYEEYDEKSLMDNFETFGYKVSPTIIHDIDKRPLNIHCTPNDDRLRGTPTIDIYAFYPKKGTFLYTYDFDKKGKKIPDRYVFKDIPKNCIQPAKWEVDRVLKGSAPEQSQLLKANGMWSYDVFEDHGSYKMSCPFGYGRLLDIWYPGWRFRQYYKGQSKSYNDHLIVKSCGDI
jgi:hypothetical protein